MKYTHIIYGLYDSRDKSKLVMYVGKTNRKLEKRLKAHYGDTKKGRRGAWIKNLKSKGAKVMAVVLEIIESDDADAFREPERRLVKYHRSINPMLLNDMPGGFGVGEFSDSLRAKMRSAKLGRKLSMKTRKKMSLAKRGIKKSPEHIAKVAAAIRGLKRTPEQCRQNSERQIGKKLSKSHRAKIKAGWLRFSKSPAMDVAREKLRMTHLGKKKTPEAIEKTRLANIGIKRSLKSRAKMRASRLAFCEHQKRIKFQTEHEQLSFNSRSVAG